MIYYAFLLLSAAIAKPPTIDKIAGHRLFAVNATEFVATGPVRFAVVGNTRGRVPALDKNREGHGEPTKDVVGDITLTALTTGLDFVALTGDQVRTSTVAEWSEMNQTFLGLLDGQTAPLRSIKRVPGLAVAGDRDGHGDTTYKGLEGAFPGTGVSIGFGRVATWSAFDVRSSDAVWRFIVLDSNKESLGPRWNEQLAWLPTVLSGPVTGILVFVHDPAVNLAGDRRVHGPTKELLDALEAQTSMLSIKAVFSAGPGASQAALPGGHFDALHVGTGGGGMAAQDLYRHTTTADGVRVPMAPGLGEALNQRLANWTATDPISDRTRAKAARSGNFKGTDGVFLAHYFPTYGWWKVVIDGGQLDVVFRMRQPDGTHTNTWSTRYKRSTGWVAKHP
jgi:hypothetical protein